MQGGSVMWTHQVGISLAALIRLDHLVVYQACITGKRVFYLTLCTTSLCVCECVRVSVCVRGERRRVEWQEYERCIFI